MLHIIKQNEKLAHRKSGNLEENNFKSIKTLFDDLPTSFVVEEIFLYGICHRRHEKLSISLYAPPHQVRNEIRRSNFSSSPVRITFCPILKHKSRFNGETSCRTSFSKFIQYSLNFHIVRRHIKNR